MLIYNKILTSCPSPASGNCFNASKCKVMHIGRMIIERYSNTDSAEGIFDLTKLDDDHIFNQ